MISYYTTRRKFIIPLYDIGTLAAGFYIGYNEGKGIDVSPTIEYLTKYGPTAFTAIMTPITIKLTTSMMKWTNKKMRTGLETGEIEVQIKGYTKKYRDLDSAEKDKISSKILESSTNLESKINSQKYLKPTMIAGTRTAIETVIGYTIGRIYSNVN